MSVVWQEEGPGAATMKPVCLSDEQIDVRQKALLLVAEIDDLMRADYYAWDLTAIRVLLERLNNKMAHVCGPLAPLS